LHLNVRISTAELRQHGREPINGKSRQASNTQASTPLSPLLTYLVERSFEFQDSCIGFVNEINTRSRESNLAGGPREQLQTNIVTDLQKQLKPGNIIQVIGQIESMNGAFLNLGIGLLFAAVFVYLLMVVNYQNFDDPFVVILALPATLCGIVTMLFVTDTTLNVPSLMGAIMAVGVASANSILLVTFAREQQLAGKTAFQAAIEAGHTRIRPVLMTAAAMIVGMIPMAIGGAGEEQNAALARAVIGGLLFATPTTLFLVPYLFALLRKGNDGKPHHGVFDEVPE
jgi:multidrug efflux pump subunit AcrB